MKKVLRLAALALFCFAGCFFMFRLIRDGFIPLALFVGAALVFVMLVFLRRALSPWRWLAAGIVMALLFTVYPIFYTVYLSFTNMSGGHLLTKPQARQRIAEETYTPDDAASWRWTAYRRGQDFLLLLEAADGTRMTVVPGSAARPFAAGIAPMRIDGYTMLSRPETVRSLEALGALDFGEADETFKVRSLSEIAVTRRAYRYNAQDDSFTSARSGEVFRPEGGAWVGEAGGALSPGFITGAGFSNYTRFLGNRGCLKPALGIFAWNIAFALLSVLASFIIGLMIALLFEDLKYRRLIRSLLIIPYPIPVLVSIMVWRALLNENLGLVTTVIANLTGFSPRFFTNVTWARIALIVINVYLSYPYFYVLASGALKAIPADLFEAAQIDGAGSFTITRRIILPLVLRILAPLVIASFCFNFNNFTLIWGFNAGLPAMADTIVPMGHTDLLISFIYRLGFSTSNAADYGFSAAITVLLFMLVALMVFFQTWRSKTIRGEI
ncbi:MAG: ABC transporter permease subunit [Treponema sp.]|jgi:ABC-type sugar transport system permease subunit|nr:ABC transporter permease subunit [Treponema sp.]